MRVIRDLKPNWADMIIDGVWDARIMATFSMLAEYCFIHDVNSPAAKAFQNALRALYDGKVNRNSAEYEQLLNY